MIIYHKTGTYKGKPIIERMNAQEHWDYLMVTRNIYHDDNGCWYIDLADVGGYPQVKHRRQMRTLTRLMAAVEKRCEVEDLDGLNDSWGHKCHNKACVNPAHGRVVSHKVNCYDGDKGARNPVCVRAENEHEVLLFPSMHDAERAGFNKGKVSEASRGVYHKDYAHGGTHWYRGYYWTQVKS